jgi:hypothetical protein
MLGRLVDISVVLGPPIVLDYLKYLVPIVPMVPVMPIGIVSVIRRGIVSVIRRGIVPVIRRGIVPVIRIGIVAIVAIVTIASAIPIALDQVTGACAETSTNQGPFPSARQAAYHRATGASDKNALPGTNAVIGIPILMPSRLTKGRLAWRQ